MAHPQINDVVYPKSIFNISSIMEGEGPYPVPRITSLNSFSHEI